MNGDGGTWREVLLLVGSGAVCRVLDKQRGFRP